MDLVTVAAVASAGYGLLAWWWYERTWDGQSWFGRAFWLNAALPVFLFTTAAFTMAFAAQGR